MLKMRSTENRMAPKVTACLALCLLAVMLSCGGGDRPAEVTKEEAPAGAEGGAVWKPTGQEGSVTGNVSFKGTAPKYRAISMDADSVCASKHSGPVYPETVEASSKGQSE